MALIECELFGHEKGAFTGAAGQAGPLRARRAPGRSSSTRSATSPVDLQTKLLRVLQEREIEPLGGDADAPASTSADRRDPPARRADGCERGLPRGPVLPPRGRQIHVPPLRERSGTSRCWRITSSRGTRASTARASGRVSTPAIHMLTSYHWPGNVREVLQKTIERAVLVCEGGVIHGHHLPPTLQTAEASDTVARQSLAESVEAFERDLLQDALKTSRGSCARAWRASSARPSASSTTRSASTAYSCRASRTERRFLRLKAEATRSSDVGA